MLQASGRHRHQGGKKNKQKNNLILYTTHYSISALLRSIEIHPASPPQNAHGGYCIRTLLETAETLRVLRKCAPLSPSWQSLIILHCRRPGHLVWRRGMGVNWFTLRNGAVALSGPQGFGLTHNCWCCRRSDRAAQLSTGRLRRRQTPATWLKISSDRKCLDGCVMIL